MSVYKMFGTDKDAEKKGVWLVYGTAGIRVRRAAKSNRRYKVTLEEKLAPYRRLLESGVTRTDDATERALERVMMEVYAESIVTEWRGIEDPEGNELPFTTENFIKVMTDLPDLWDDVRRGAGEMDLFAVVSEGEQKNS